ncbi:hypothetical protein CTI12_AA568390 [Artemisia annua]|uniref:Uncharacterized protein n=1 Tax=Artemisia annua TaxID=35608 RepID=A0A2U1KSR3_ARTAN|nr:hypothetical protein CTI12_AA568390 [Artemisia annua]
MRKIVRALLSNYRPDLVKRYAAGEDRYCIKIQPPLAYDADERWEWAFSFIETSGIKVIKTLYSDDRYARFYEALQRIKSKNYERWMDVCSRIPETIVFAAKNLLLIIFKIREM